MASKSSQDAIAAAMSARTVTSAGVSSSFSFSSRKSALLRGAAARGRPERRPRARAGDSAARNLSAARRTTIASYAAAASLAWSRNDSGSPEPEGSYCRSSPRAAALSSEASVGERRPESCRDGVEPPELLLAPRRASITIFSPTVINATASRRMRRASASASADDSGGKEETSRRTSRIAWWFSLCAETSARSVAALALVKALAAATPGEPGANRPRKPSRDDADRITFVSSFPRSKSIDARRGSGSSSMPAPPFASPHGRSRSLEVGAVGCVAELQLSLCS